MGMESLKGNKFPGAQKSPHVLEAYPSQFPQVTHLEISAAWDGPLVLSRSSLSVELAQSYFSSATNRPPLNIEAELLLSPSTPQHLVVISLNPIKVLCQS